MKRHLPSYCNWDIKTTGKFKKYLLDYEKLPNYKKLIRPMAKFSEMYVYRPPRPGTVAWAFGEGPMMKEYLSIKRAQTYMNKKDLVNTFDNIHGRRLVLTSRGHKIFYHDYPLAKLRKEKWDGHWTIVMYDFPEKIRRRRTYIRDKLLKLGFGSPQISILVSPLPLAGAAQELIEGEGLEKYIWVLSAERVLGMDNREVAKKAWPIEELNYLYKVLLDSLSKAKKAEGLVLAEWRLYFLALNTADPYLPFELLPEDWVGEKAEKEFVKLGFGGALRLFFKKISS